MLNKAMIMAAGVGSRLGALSAVVPKPLVPVANIPVTDIIIERLTSFGIKNFIANTHYKSEMIINRFKDNKNFNMSFVEEKELSGTAGGLKKCRFFFDKDNQFVVLSGDGLTDVNIPEAYNAHVKSGAIATIVIKNIDKAQTCKYGIVVPDQNGFVQSFQEKPRVDLAKSTLANTGIYIFDYRIFDFIPENTFCDFAKNVFPALMNSGEKINTFETKGYWSDIGSIEQYKQSNIDLINGKLEGINVNVTESSTGKFICDESVLRGQNCVIDLSVIGKNCKIGKNCVIKNSVIWNNVKIKDGITVENCIILPNSVITKSISNLTIEPEVKEMII